ncbi:hypothetical protein KY290_038244 [Solanum tuberosum]|uniref:Uncharacterized protein n=1 Tax=Solanum tuberosum TaxID=4113 RepID=A0ABQ7TXW8_SOLTU|nr:hypothetical protein KY290_038244 [Solanum tuberosum]
MSGVGSCEEDAIAGLNGFNMDLFHCFWNMARSDIIEGGRRLLNYSKRWWSMLHLVLARHKEGNT